MNACGLCLLWDRPLESISLSSCFFFTKDKRRRKRHEITVQRYKDSQEAIQQRASSYPRQTTTRTRKKRHDGGRSRRTVHSRSPKATTTKAPAPADVLATRQIRLTRSDSHSSDSNADNHTYSSNLWETASSWGDTSTIISEDWSDASDVFFHVPSSTSSANADNATNSNNKHQKSRSFPYRIPRNEERRRTRSKRTLARRIALEQQDSYQAGRTRRLA